MRIRSSLKIFSGKLDFISLIDLFFLLLIFFLVSTAMIFQPGIPIDLPPSHTDTASASEKIIITITGANDIFLNDQPVPKQELQQELQRIVENRTSFTMSRLNLKNNEPSSMTAPRVVLRADQKVSFEQIAEVVSLARSLGLGVYLLTDPENE